MQSKVSFKKFHAVKVRCTVLSFKIQFQFWKKRKEIYSCQTFGRNYYVYRVNKGIYKMYLSVHSKTLKKVKIYLQALVAKGWGH